MGDHPARGRTDSRRSTSTRQGTGIGSAENPLSATVELTDDDLSVFFDLSTELFGVFEPLGGLVWCNPSVAVALGYEPHELRRVNLSDLVHPDDLGVPTDDLEDFPRDGSSLTLEVRCRAKDESWRWLEWSGTWDPGSRLLYGAGRDVTDRHLTRAALVRNERLLQAILDHSEAAIQVENLGGRLVVVNDAFLRLVGREREEVLGRTAAEAWHPRADPGSGVDRTVMTEGRSVTRDDVIEVDGTAHTFMTVRFPVRDNAGTVVGMATIATDISERTDMERRLADRQRLLDTIVQACPDIVTILDSSGRVREVSQASSRILGYDLEHADQEQLESLVHPEDLAAVSEAYGKLLDQSQTDLDTRYRVRHRDGHWVTLETRGQTVVGEGGQTEGAVVVSRDCTPDLAFEEDLQSALAQAEQASTAKSEFLSRMSHELRTPLNSVLGFAQLLAMDDLQGEQGQAVEHILRAGAHLLDLIDEVLDIARIESGRLALSMEPVAVVEVVGDAVDLTRPSAAERGIAVEVDLDLCPEVTHVRADRQRLLQVLLNLLSNGVKYNARQGTVSVSVRVEGSRVRIAVADTGPGIDPEDVERVFRPFDRLGAERSNVEGTGVGLTVSKHLVEQMGGTIELKSELGAGAVFTVSLALDQRPKLAGSSSTRPVRRQAGGEALRILHIEDNLANLELVEQVLLRAGAVELRAAMFGGLGLELAREQPPDLVLLDMHLPDMMGTEVIERLRSRPETAEVPIVVVSADATPQRVEGLQGSEVLAYLTKPIDVHELLRVVEVVSAREPS